MRNKSKTTVHIQLKIEIAEFLEQASKASNQTKSEYVNNLISKEFDK